MEGESAVKVKVCELKLTGRRAGKVSSVNWTPDSSRGEVQAVSRIWLRSPELEVKVSAQLLSVVQHSRLQA